MSGSVRLSLSRRRLIGGTAALAGAGLGLPALFTPAEAAEGTLRAGITGYSVMNTLDPGKATLIPEYYVIWGLFNCLLKFNSKMELVPDLATSYTQAVDGTLEFKLRPNVTFHDGSPMTSEDVKFTIERLLDPKFASPNVSSVSAIDAVTTPDPLTVRIKTKGPFAPLLTYLANARTGTQIVPKKALTAMGAEAFGQKPIGTGAFVLRRWVPKERVDLAAYSSYFRSGLPKLQAVTMPLIPEETSGVTALLGHQIDLTSTAPFADIPGLRKNKTIQVFSQPGLDTRFISLNNQKPPFDDVHLRRAASMAFDRRAMVEVVLFGQGVPSHGLIPPSLAFAYNPKPYPFTVYDPERAKAEFAKSRYKAGVKATILTWGDNWWKRIVEVWTAQVNETLGTRFTIQVTDGNTVYARLRSGDYQASVWGWIGFVDPDQYLYDICYSTGFRNFERYSDPKLDALLLQARTELDRTKRGDLYRQAEAMMITDMPIIPCFCSDVQNLGTANLSGFVQLPYSNYGDTFQDITLS